MLHRDASIQKKMVWSSLIITMIPLLVMELTFFVLIQREIRSKFEDSASAYANQLKENYADEMDKLEHLAGTLSSFSPLANYLSMDFPDDASMFNYYRDNIHPMLTTCNNAYDGIRVRIYHDNPNIRNFSFELNNDLSGFVRQHFPNPGGLNTAGTWQQNEIGFNTYHPVFSYYLAVREKNWPYKISYVVSLHMDESSFYTQISNEPVENGLVFVTDHEGDILTSNLRSAVGGTAADYCSEDGATLLGMKDESRVTLNGRDYLAFSRSTKDLNVIFLLSYESVLSELRHSMTALALIGLLLLGLSYLALTRISRQITGGIYGLMRKMQNIDRTSIRTIAAFSSRQGSRDEVVQLDAVFTDMMAQIDVLVDEIQGKEQKLKDEVIARQQAEIRALQHQINPHYLFNTLEAIRMNLIMKDDRENAEIVKLFAESFRRYVDLREEDATLFEEVEFIKKYIRIQNYRLNNKITFTSVIEESALRYRVLKFLLQPLVENAVCHGLEMKAGPGTIRMEIRRSGEALQIRVEDDGVGMTEPELEALRGMVYAAQPEHSVGLHNVYQRIRLVYGPDAEMTIESAAGRGTRVLLTLPIQRLEASICSKS
jgi:two-component system sensor histidine kinase YesM